MTTFGWCSDGFHEGGEYRYGTPCPGRVGTGEECGCRCHTGESVTDTRVAQGVSGGTNGTIGVASSDGPDGALTPLPGPDPRYNSIYPRSEG